MLLDAEFLTAVQLVVYAGGTLVLIVFGVMLTSQSPLARLRASGSQMAVAACVGGVLLVALSIAIQAIAGVRAATATTVAQAPRGTAGELGRMLLGDYLVPFELASVILLVVMIGTAYLARSRRRANG